MANLTDQVTADILGVLPLDDINHVVDVGGGTGHLLAALLAHVPRATGVLFDLPSVANQAADCWRDSPVRPRLACVGGDFFTEVPGDGDLYLLKSVLHDWAPERAAALLRCCRRAMPATGRLVIVERIVPSTMTNHPMHRAIAAADLNLLVALGGCERTAEEFEVLLLDAGFGVPTVLPAGPLFSLIETRPLIAAE